VTNTYGQVTNNEIRTNKRYSYFFTVKPSNIRMLSTLHVFGIFGLYQTKYMYRYMQYLYWYTINFLFGSKFSVSFGIIPIIRSAKEIIIFKWSKILKKYVVLKCMCFNKNFSQTAVNVWAAKGQTGVQVSHPGYCCLLPALNR